jgi:hypothetical protein
MDYLAYPEWPEIARGAHKKYATLHRRNLRAIHHRAIAGAETR